MRPTRAVTTSCALLLTTLAFPSADGRDLASISWQEFKQRSDFVFQGLLVKAEMLDTSGGRASMVRYTYKVWRVFKGQEANLVVFDAPREEDVNKCVGGIAIVALRRAKDKQNKDAWKLSVDQRSCWTHDNRMAAKDFHGVPVFEIPTSLIRDLPTELSEEISIKVRYGDNYRDEKKTLYPLRRVEEKLKSLLAE